MEKSNDEQPEEELAANEGDGLDDDEEEMSKNEANEKAAKYAALEQELTQLKSELQRAEREKVFTQLNHEGYSIDVENELGFCAQFSDEQFNGYVERVKTNYAKAPVNIKQFAFADVDNSGIPQKPTDKELDEIRDKAIKQGLDFKTLYKQHMGA